MSEYEMMVIPVSKCKPVARSVDTASMMSSLVFKMALIIPFVLESRLLKRCECCSDKRSIRSLHSRQV